MLVGGFLAGVILFSCAVAGLEVVFSSNYATYSLVHLNQTLFVGEGIAVHSNHAWNVHNSIFSNLTLVKTSAIDGSDAVLGSYKGVQFSWKTSLGVQILSSAKTFTSGVDVVFEVSFPTGATDTNIDDGQSDGVLINWPAFTTVVLPSYLSWEGSFVQPTFSYSNGRSGGPTVFYNSSDPALSMVVMAGPWGCTSYKSFSSGNGASWNGTQAWAPGTSGSIRSLGPHYTQGLLLHAGQGVTATVAEWGQHFQAAQPSKGQKIPDVTLAKVGYQTDNGAMYCFCPYSNCSKVLLDVMSSLSALGCPMGYLSFQGAGASSGRGQAAPWCVNTWGVDGGLGHQYPLNLSTFQKALGIPLQLYAPYFCPSSPYFNNTNWTAVPSDTKLPGCNDFAFLDVSAPQSREFYDWFLAKGLAVGMASFEPDFMNQNYNCVADFIDSTDQADTWQLGMAGAALAVNVTVQWCFATPTDILAAVNMPSVTNFRVSNDFCYGTSWDIGVSSLLVWSLGGFPSKDTLWTTPNNRTAIPGCQWTPDHEAPAAELHVVLALLSNGPVGISDAIGFTNATLLQRTITQDGTLLKPLKSVTAIDASYLHSQVAHQTWHAYTTYALGPSWLFVSFKASEPVPVRIADLYPALPAHTAFLLSREFHGAPCLNNTAALQSGCVTQVMLPPSPDALTTLVHLPASSFVNVTGGTDFAPAVTTLWLPQCTSGVVLLGELAKYVSLSPARFQSITCTDAGLSTRITGSSAELVSLTALRTSTAHSGVEGATDFTVLVRDVTVPPAGFIDVDF